jgi:hypothetical protein
MPSHTDLQLTVERTDRVIADEVIWFEGSSQTIISPLQALPHRSWDACNRARSLQKYGMEVKYGTIG